MKKHFIYLLITFISLPFITAQVDLSGPKPIIQVLNPTTGSYQNLNGATLELGCGVASYCIRATWTDIGSPNEYRVESIPYTQQPYLVNGTTPANGFVFPSVNDDNWSAVQTLSTNAGADLLSLCFFGNARNQITLSSNGAISFNLGYAGGYSDWTIHNMGKIAPSANMNPYAESILSPFHDTDPQHGNVDPINTFSYWDVKGNVGERYLIYGTHEMPMYSCDNNGDPRATHQVVFYETTNIIEFNIKKKPICPTWAGGFAALGIQNAALNLGYSAPGRDNLELWRIVDNAADPFLTSDPTHTSMSESWRFIPDGVLGVAPLFTWYENYNHATETGDLLGSDPHNPYLCVAIGDVPTAGVVYTAVVTYTDYCTGLVFNAATDVQFGLSDPMQMHIKERNSTDDTIEFHVEEQLDLCLNDNYTLEAIIQGFDNTDGSTLTYQWYITQGVTPIAVIPGATSATFDIINAQVGTYVYTLFVIHDSTMIGGDICFYDDTIAVRVYDTPQFDYPAPGVYCASDADPIPLNISPAVGIWTISNGGVWTNPEVNPLQSLDGIIDLTNSMDTTTGGNVDGTGVFAVTYTIGAGCFLTKSITINNAPNILDPEEDPNSTPANLPIDEISKCETNATLHTADFDTAAIETFILNNLTGLTLTYEYTTSAGLQVVNTMPNPFNTTTITIRVTAVDPADPASCPTEIIYDLTVLTLPTIGNPINNLILCENIAGTGIASFNGVNLEATILNGQNPLLYTIVYTAIDSDGNPVTMTSPLAVSFDSVSVTVTAVVIPLNGNTSGGCTSSPTTFDLVVRDIPTVTVPTTDLIKCETDTTNHTASFDTSTWNTTALSGNSTPINADFVVSYTYHDGTAMVTETSSTLPNPLVIASQTISVSASNITAGQQTCTSNASTFIIVVNPKPVGVNQTPTTCSDVALNLDLDTFTTLFGAGVISYSWQAADNPNVTGETSTASTTSLITDTLNNVSGINQDVIYTITPTTVDNCDGDNFTITVTVQPEPVGTATPVTACSNVVFSQDLSAITTIAGTTFSWIAADNPDVTGETTIATNSAIISETLVNTSTTNQNVLYTVTPTGANGCTGDTFIVTVNVGNEPNMSNQTDTICSDDTLAIDLDTFTSLTANSYSWIAAANANVAGETTTATAGTTIGDTLNNVSGIAQDVIYTVTPTSSNSCIGTAFTVTITVNPEPVGTNQTPTTCSDVVLNLDLDTFTNLAGAGNTFSWIAADNPNVTGETTTTSTTALITDTLNNVSGTNQDVVYTVTPTSALTCEGNPFTVTVTVQPEPVGTPTPVTACSNVVFSQDLSAITTIAGTTFSWIATDNPDVTGETIVATNGSIISETLINTSATNQDVIYTVTPTGANGCTGDTFIVTVNVGNEPNMSNQADTICSDDTLAIDLDTFTSLTNNSYSWIAAANANVTGETTSATLSTTIGDTLNNVSGVAQDVIYTVTPTSSNACEGTAFTVTITVNPEPVGTNLTPTTCSDVALNLDLDTFTTLVGTGNTFSWIATDNPNVSGETTTASTTAFITDTLNNVSGTNQDVVYTVTPTSALTCEGNPFTVTVTVGNEPNISNQADTVCSDDVLTIDLNSYTTLVGTTYTWIATDNPNVSGETLVLSNTTTIGDTLNNISNAPQDVIYTITPTNGCTGNDFTVTITINPEPVGTTPVTINACSDVALSIDLEDHTSMAGTNNSYLWVAADNPNVTGEELVGSSAGTIMDVITNTSGIPQDVVYTITPTSIDGCAGNPFTITVKVGQKPVEIIPQPVTAVVCSDDVLNIDLTTYTTLVGNTYSWVATDNTDVNVTGETTTDTASSLINDVIHNITETAQTIIYTIKPTSAQGCEGTAFVINVTVNPEPKGTNTPELACSDTPFTLNLDDYTTLFGLGNTYSWIATDNANITGETLVQTNANTISETLTNVSGSSQIVVYTITPTSSQGCEGDSFVISVSVGVEPVGTDSSLFTCSDSALSINLDDYTDLVDNTYSWVATDNTNTNVTGETIIVATTDIISDTLTNTSGTTQFVIYTITPTSKDGCAGNPFVLTIEVGFEPVGTVATEVICNDDTLNLDLSLYTTLINNTYTWFATNNPNVDGETSTMNSSSIINDRLSNTSGLDQFVVYTITPTSAGDCLGDPFTITVTVNPQPQFNLEAQYYICPEIQTAEIGDNSNPTTYTYQWFVATDMTTALPTVDTTGRTLEVTEAEITANGGIYALTATDTNGCTFTQLTSVSMAEQMVITNVFVNDFDGENNSITIEVTGGSGAFEYTLTDGDGNSTTQLSNVFNGLEASTYQIEVTDLTGCSIIQIQDDIHVLDYLPFFTPNGDIINDTWQIQGANLIPNSKIYIFDRYGKILAQIDPTSVVGWDGLYNGRQMPASDYWFSVDYIDPNNQQIKKVNGHFSIIRR